MPLLKTRVTSSESSETSIRLSPSYRPVVQSVLLRGSLLLVLAASLVACQPDPPASRESAPNASETGGGPSNAAGEDDAAAGDTREPAEEDRAIADADLEIVDILPMDAIPAIDRPEFWTVDEADRRYQPEELVLGVAFDGEARAYSVPFLSRHEIVNDSVGGRAITVTW